MKLAFTVPGPPVPKARARVVTRGDKAVGFTPKATRDYEKHVQTIAWASVTQARWPYMDPCAVTVRVYRAAKRGDLDNYLKAICDGMEGAVYFNDRQIRRVSAELIDGDSNPRVEVEVETL